MNRTKQQLFGDIDFQKIAYDNMETGFANKIYLYLSGFLY